MKQPRDFTTSEIAGLIRDVRDAKCRSSYDQGCRCPVHGDGSHAPRLSSTKLAAVTMTPAALPSSCSGSMTCICQHCVAERAQLVRRPRETPRQPWEVAAAA